MYADVLQSSAAAWLLAMTSSQRPDRTTPAGAVTREATGDAQAQLERLYVAVELRLTNVVYRYLWDREETRDVVQEAFMRLWHKRDRVDWSRAEALAFKIALDLARNRRRGRRVWQWVGLDRIIAIADPAADPREQLDAAGDEQLLRAAVDQLPEGLRRVLLLCTFSDLSHDQIAAVLELAPGTVGSRRHEAIKRIRLALEEGTQ